MTTNQKLVVIILILVTLGYIKYAFFTDKRPSLGEQTQIEEPMKGDDEDDESSEEKIQYEYINVFFIGRNENGEEYYRAVKRKYNKDSNGQKLSFAISRLMEGPSMREQQKGVYSEIPSGTKVISVVETGQKAIINLTSDFENGGGTDGLYKRLYQLVKTANMNTEVPVYLYINNKQADVIGGDGLMIKQPLNERIFND